MTGIRRRVTAVGAMPVLFLKDQTTAEKWGGSLRALLISVFLFTTLMALNLLQVVTLVIRPFSLPKFREANTKIAGLWWGWCVKFSEYTLRIKPIISGDPVPVGENAMVFANHQQQPDIVALMMLAMRAERIGNLKWFVKKPLKYLPGVGWGLTFLDALFVERTWHSDEGMIQRTFSSFLKYRIPLWLISFSEGTRITPEKLASSRAYAGTAGLPLPQWVLIPRTKGFVAAVSGLREHLRAVYDVTIGYPSGIPHLGQWLRGRVKVVHLHVRRFPIESLPKDPTALGRWLLERFVEKDRLLERLHSVGSFV